MTLPMMWRVWQIEARRHVGWPLLIVWVAISCLLLFTHLGWQGEFLSLALTQRTLVIVLGPIAVTLAVWAGGRDRRRGLTELLGSTSTVAWRRHVVRWAALTSSLFLGVLVTFAAGAAFVFDHTTYLGGRWSGELLVQGAGLGALVALGMAVGALVPWRVVAPMAGVATYVGLGVPGYLTPTGFQNLLPNGVDGFLVAYQPTRLSILVLTVFFGVVTAVFVLLMSSGRRWLAVPFGVVAIGVALMAGHQPEGWWSAVDETAAAPVCTAEAPVVCVMRTHARLLPAVTSELRPILTQMGDLAPQQGVRESPLSRAEPRTDRLITFTMYGQLPLVGDRLTQPAELRFMLTESPGAECFDFHASQGEIRQQGEWIRTLDHAWNVLLFRDPADDDPQNPIPQTLSTASVVQQRQFLHGYQTAGLACDYAAIGRLYDRWTP